MDIKALTWDYNSGTVLEGIVCIIIMCEFHFYMHGLHRTCKGMLTVQLCHSIILEVYL